MKTLGTMGLSNPKMQNLGIALAFLLLFPSCAKSGSILFDYEKTVLTDEHVKSLREDPSTAQYADLVDFDNEVNRTTPLLESGSCKVFPGDADWPSQETWDAFERILDGDGALIPTVPLASPCYPEWPNYNAEKCEEITNNWTLPLLHEADPTSNMWPLWQGRTCLPGGASKTCDLGGYPAVAVNISSVSQIQLAINFARNTNIRLVIKNTGHCYLGKSSGAGALSIWTHNLKNIEYYENYTGSGYSGKAFKLGAGVTVREVYEAAEKYGVSALGGICASVGYAGGYVAGGGHTPLSGLYGMAADHVMGLQVVTADGRFVTASPTSHPDLFWALRGGGGGTYGVVTSIIIRVHPKVPVTVSTFSFNSSTAGADAFWAGMRSYLEHFIPFTDAGTYSWFKLYNTNGTYSMTLNPFFAPNHTIASFNNLVQPWFQRLTALGLDFTPNTTYHPSYLPAFEVGWGNDPTTGQNRVGGWDRVPGNRLLPRANWEDAALFNQTFDALRRHSEAGHYMFGYHQAPRNRAHADNAVSSAFRNVIAFLITAVYIDEEDSSAADLAEAARVLNDEVLRPWREVAPASRGGGAYLNEANVMEVGWREDFYGTQYERLVGIKREYDPRGLFYVTTGVGSEEYEVRSVESDGVVTQNGRLCRL